MSPRSSNTKPNPPTHKPNDTELMKFYKEMSKVGKPVLLSIIPNFCNRYNPRSVKGVLSFLLTDTFEKDLHAGSYLYGLTNKVRRSFQRPSWLSTFFFYFFIFFTYLIVFCL